MLRIDGVVKDYPLRRGVLGGSRGHVRALDGVSLDIAKKGCFGLVGESGCGKSTLTRIVLALERPDGGRVEAAGRDPQGLRGRALKRWRRDVQLVAQDPYGALPARMRVGRILEEPWRIHGIEPAGGRRAGVKQLLAQVGLPARHADAYPHQLSGGQRQRVAIARALALTPKVLVCDEPVSALDVSVQAQMLELLRRLQADMELTYLFISHDLGVVRAMADAIGVMFAGRLVERGPAGDVYARPLHPYTRELLDAMPSIHARGRRPQGPAPVSPAMDTAEVRARGCPYRARCPLAIDRCAVEKPDLRELVTGRLAACHRAEDMLASGAVPSTLPHLTMRET